MLSNRFVDFSSKNVIIKYNYIHNYKYYIVMLVWTGRFDYRQRLDLSISFSP